MIPAADLKILEEIENRLDLRSALAALEANRNEKTVLGGAEEEAWAHGPSSAGSAQTLAVCPAKALDRYS